jgi:hypothetical protein
MMTCENIYYRDNYGKDRIGNFIVNRVKLTITKYSGNYWIEFEMYLVDQSSKLLTIDHVLQLWPVFNVFNIKKLITKNMIIKTLSKYTNKFPSAIFHLVELNHSFNYKKIILRSVEISV